jgi:hypothetical protein
VFNDSPIKVKDSLDFIFFSIFLKFGEDRGDIWNVRLQNCIFDLIVFMEGPIYKPVHKFTYITKLPQDREESMDILLIVLDRCEFCHVLIESEDSL